MNKGGNVVAENYCVHNRLITEFIDEHFGEIRAPFTAGFELTAKCNLDCIHCYAKPAREHTDFTMSEFKQIFDTLVDYGLMDCYFTGGEIFARHDFEELYKYAKKKGVLVSLLSNITLLNDKHIELFKEYPPEVISTSMYGYSKETYEAVTGVEGSYDRFMKSLNLLKENDINFEIKFVAMKQNIGDLYKVRELGKQLGVQMIVSLDIHPMNNGSKEPMEFRVSPEKAFEFDVKDEGRSQFWKKVAQELISGEVGMIPKRTAERFAKGYLYPCSIGNQHVFITSDYKMQGCVRASYWQYDLKKGSFDEGWKQLQYELIDKKASLNYKCRTCDKIRFCEHCVANFKLMFDDEEHVDSFLCRVAELRKNYVKDEMKGFI